MAEGQSCATEEKEEQGEGKREKRLTMFWVFCTGFSAGFAIGLAIGMFFIAHYVARHLCDGLILVLRDSKMRWIESE